MRRVNAAVFRRDFRELDDLFAIVRRAGGEPQLTGSGPTIFSLTDDPERASAVAAALAAQGLRATMTATRGVPSAVETIEEEN